LKKNGFGTSLLTKLALFTALAVVFNFIPGFSMLPVVSFIHYEFSDIPLLIAAFMFGALPGIGAAFVSILISFLLGAEGGGPYGALMHFIAIGFYILAAGIVYARRRTMGGALIGMLIGIAAMTLVMIPANLLITPLYTNASVSAVKALLLPGIIPVNLIKGAITAAITFIAYKRVKKLLFREKSV